MDGPESEGKPAPRRILFVSENRAECLELKELLALYSPAIGLDTSPDGLGAFRKLIKERYDLVLLDFFLPDSDGEAVLLKLKELRPSLPVVIMAGKGAEEMAAHLLRLGASDYVLKGPNFNHDALHVIGVNLERVGRERTISMLQGLVASLPVAVAVVDGDGTIVLANRRACELAGRERLEGVPIKEAPLVRADLAAACTECIEGGSAVPVQGATVHPLLWDGRPAWAAVICRQ